jgi:hypothetical protein
MRRPRYLRTALARGIVMPSSQHWPKRSVTFCDPSRSASISRTGAFGSSSMLTGTTDGPATRSPATCAHPPTSGPFALHGSASRGITAPHPCPAGVGYRCTLALELHGPQDRKRRNTRRRLVTYRPNERSRVTPLDVSAQDPMASRRPP